MLAARVAGEFLPPTLGKKALKRASGDAGIA